MRLLTKILTGGVLFIVLLIAGFMFLLRGCLSKYDERYAIPPALYFEQNEKKVAFSIVKYDECTSYQQNGGFISKSVDNHCFIQCNDALTGEKILSKELKRPKKNRNYNEQVLGSSGNNAWVFIDELMAFDAFTLEKTADVKLIEDKNPQLKGMLPQENRFYHFDNANKTIAITAKDGAKWALNTTTMLAAIEEVEPEKKIDMEERDWLAKLKNMQRINLSFSEMIINQDTIDGQWFGLYSKEELDKLDERVRITTAYSQEARRLFFTGNYNKIRDNNFEIDKPALKNVAPQEYFLDGGFLLNKQTGNPIFDGNPDSYFLICKSQIGNEGEIILCRLAKSGKVLWKLNTHLTNWTTWNYLGNNIFIIGTDKKKLNNTKCNILMSINIDSGKESSYDFFTDKIREQDNKK